MVHVSKPELKALTSLRGIAALFVLAHHFMFVLLWDVAVLMPSKLFLKSYLWVDLFFMLSGFVLAYVYQNQFKEHIPKQDYVDFMRARFARIYPLHFFILGLFVVIELVQWLLVQTHIPGAENLTPPFTADETPLSLLSNVLLLQTLHWVAYWNQPAWSISAEWLIYFCVPFLIYHFFRAGVYLQVLYVFVVLTALTATELHYGSLGLDYAGWPMLVRCLGECVLGVIAFRCYQLGYFSRMASAAWLLPILLLNVLLMALPIPGVISVGGFFWLVLSAARVQSHWILTNAYLVYLGKISYSIYMVHWFVLELLRASSLFFSGKPLADNLNLTQELGVFLLAALASIFLAALTYRFVETPWRNRLLRRDRSL